DLAAFHNRTRSTRRCLVGPRSSRQADQGQQRPVAGLENRAFSSSELSNVRRRLVWTKIGPFKAQTCVCARAVTQKFGGLMSRPMAELGVRETERAVCYRRVAGGTGLRPSCDCGWSRRGDKAPTAPPPARSSLR